ncbi:uncharacterized protein LOC113217526 [Frankliniella occidentalis]|uniref:Uncharacterized protein LOC113217526 n=1 Tax=Frankliniella occidentalis TaxID=133901 RepID=A0A6J1TNR3_FRAOC|nr:uncharacterized protein LOC113217526 [Frankliniella occidentalis]
MGDGLMDFRERCRLCIEPKRLSIDIFSEEGRRIKLKSKINKNLPLKVSQSDGLPNQICYQCLFRLETWVSFKQLCMERDQVMKTWSQPYLDETCESHGSFNGVKSTKSGKLKVSSSPQIANVHPIARDEESNIDGFASSNQMDDAKSDTSVWEVVKRDDADNVDCESLEKNAAQSPQDNVNASDYCISQENMNDEKHDWNRRKARKPSKVASSGSDMSSSNDLDASCSALLSQSLDSPLVSNSSCSKQSPRQLELLSSEKSPPPLKRKRGRPSKAFLQRERELKKIKDLEKPNLDEVVTTVKDSKTDQGIKVEKEIDVTENKELESGQVRLRPMTPEFTPIERDDGSGITEVVLDDPDFGSMKFTLSVVDIESPTSSPIPADIYKYNYACSNVTLSSDSLHREDFEGFESPCSSSFVKSPKDDSVSPYSEISRSRSQADIRNDDSEDNLSPSAKRKRSSSASGDFRANCPVSEDLASSGQEDETLESNGVTLLAETEKVLQLSKSLENISNLNVNTKQGSDDSEERNAYSDGELSESPSKKIRRKSLPSLMSEIVTV